MIEFKEQVAIVTGAGRGLGRLFAIELARRGACVVVNDLGGSMHGHGSDVSVADQVVQEIQRAGGAAVASHHSVETPEGGEYLRTSQFLNSIKPELVVPLVVFLASKACEVTHHNYSACAGRFARAFVGLSDGWVSERGTVPSAEEIAARIVEISATTSFTVPTSIFDEVFGVCERLSITP